MFAAARSPLFWLTLIYLIVELSFSAKLLDVAGGVSTQSDINSIEIYGRILSGIALSLVALHFLWSKERPWLYTKSIGIVLVSIFAMYLAQESLVSWLIGKLDGEQRKQAAVLAIAAPQISSGTVIIEGLDFGEDGPNSASAKSFIALFPALSLYKDNLDQDIRELAPKFIQAKLTSDCNGSKECIGNSSYFYNNTWKKIIDETQSKYKSIGSEVNQMVSDKSIQKKQSKAWKSHVNAVQNKTGYSIDDVPEEYHEAIRKRVNSNFGTSLPHGWHPSDKESFYAAIEDAVISKANRAVRKKLGRSVSGEMTFKRFFALPKIQSEIKSQLGMEGSSRKIPLVYDPKDVEHLVYDPMIKHLSNKEFKRLNDEAEEYLPGGKHEELGEEAAKRVIVPAIALLFSIIGGFGHTLKIIYLLYRGEQVLSNKQFSIFWSVLIVLLVFMPYLHTNTVVESKPYQILSEDMEAGTHFIIPSIAEWIIRSEAIVYPINNWIRVNVLVDTQFGAE